MDSTMLTGLSVLALVGLLAFLYVVIKNRKVSKHHVFFTDMLEGYDDEPSADTDDIPVSDEVKNKMAEEEQESKHFDEYK